MLLINNSMPKSGSTLLRHYISEMINLINPDAQSKLVGLIQENVFKGKGLFLSEFNQEILNRLAELYLPDNQILVKVHLDFSSTFRFLQDNPLIMMTYNYRDPRDVILSAMDHHRRAKEVGKNEFLNCDTFENAANTVFNWALNAVK